jgi:DNA-binding CsgD family transcriptional regulator
VSGLVSRLRDGASNDVLEVLPNAGLAAASDRSELELETWMEALRALPAPPVTERDIVAWVDNTLRRFLPFKAFMAIYGRWSGGRVHMLSYLSSGHTAEYLAHRPTTWDLSTRPSLAWWIANQKPYLLDETGAMDEDGAPVAASALDLDSITRFSLGLLAVHGVVDPFAKCGTYICFSGMARSEAKLFISALKLIAPVLHALFLQTRRTMLADLTALTDRQRELLDLALVGLSDKAIASRLRISDHTVGHHFRAIYAKLGVTKRSQLIALLK